MIKSYKIRLLPDAIQEEKLWKHVHAARAVWNWGLAYEMQLYKNGEKHINALALKRVLTQVKKTEEFKWLNDVSHQTLSTVILDLGKTYDKFFSLKPFKYPQKTINRAKNKGVKLTYYDLENHPKFKSKKDKAYRFPIRASELYFSDMCVNIEKIGKVNYQTNYNLPRGRQACKISNPRVKYENGKWILGFGIEGEKQTHRLTDKSLGIDLGIKELAVASFGGEKFVIHNINKSSSMQKLEHKKKHLQRSISRKCKVNGSYEKTRGIVKIERILQKTQSRLTNKRKNHTHQASHSLVSMLPRVVVMENLSVRDMQKNKHLAKAVQEQSFYEFIRQMKYKCEWNGIEFIQVNRWYPSSKTCSKCGTIKHNLKLKDRMFMCDDCGLVIDRDFNAAQNLEKYGLLQLKRSA